MDALILMTRVPIAGRTKTRLMGVFTGEECAELHRCFLLDLFKVLDKLKKNIDIYITYTPENSLRLMQDIIPDFADNFPQEGDKLGDKMRNAIQKLLHRGYSKVVLIGSDIPSIQLDDIKKAYKILDYKDICLGPTNDGGYYLVGMKRNHGEIFDDSLKWGNRSVFESTVSIANSLGLSVGITTKLIDIDEKADIIDFMVKIKKDKYLWKALPNNTINFIENIWSNVNYVKRCVK